jgi:diguanylate cyclase (GGDEF)-like protein
MLGADVLAPRKNAWRRYFGDGAWTQLHNLVHTQADSELELHSRDGAKRFLVRATLARGKIEGFLQDVTDKSKATEDLRFMANNDPLTKVYNRRGIEKAFENAVGPAAGGKPVALAYLDLDRFKLINDLFGHTAGDEVLKQVCQRIISILAAGQQVGRVGGDEFVVVMPDTAIPLATLICRGIVDSIGGSPYRVGDKAFHVRGSIGLIEVGPGMEIKDAVSAADRACREAKAGNSDGLVVYEKNAAAFHERAAELDLVERLAASTATEDLFIEMQPIMSLKAPHESLNFEVLLRMRDRDGGTIPAGRVIAAAEKSGRTGMIDRWVLSTVLAWVDAHYTRLPRTQFVCMNLSGASLNDERFVQDTLAMLEQNARAAARLCIEITESVALHDLDNTRRFIDQVRGYGVKIGLDDFGAGYTSFSYLKELPADVLKIDGNFIVNINEHPANVAIVEAIVNLAVNLGMRTIAEWAEDTATVRTLAEIGVDYVQGYAVARSQAPARLLTASSSASFIQDEELLQLVRMLGAPADAPADLSNVIRFQDLH